jgi:hypothetical protein
MAWSFIGILLIVVVLLVVIGLAARATLGD